MVGRRWFRDKNNIRKCDATIIASASSNNYQHRPNYNSLLYVRTCQLACGQFVPGRVVRTHQSRISMLGLCNFLPFLDSPLTYNLKHCAFEQRWLTLSGRDATTLERLSPRWWSLSASSAATRRSLRPPGRRGLPSTAGMGQSITITVIVN